MERTNHKGLTDKEVLESRAKYGPNVLTPPEKDSLWVQIKEVCKHPIALAMFALIACTAIAADVLASSMGANIWVMPTIVTVATLLILVVGFFGGFGDPLFKILITASYSLWVFPSMNTSGTMQSGQLSLSLLVSS